MQQAHGVVVRKRLGRRRRGKARTEKGEKGEGGCGGVESDSRKCKETATWQCHDPQNMPENVKRFPLDFLPSTKSKQSTETAK